MNCQLKQAALQVPGRLHGPAFGGITFHKCALNRVNWTGGPGSDIHLKDPACEFWKGKEMPG